MEWYNEPRNWAEHENSIEVFAEARTDFWRKTQCGLVADNGHFYYDRIAGDFTAEAQIVGEYVALYDQAGLMVRADEANWLKCGIELVDGIQHVSVVVTQDYSDWSVVQLPANPLALRMRVRRERSTIEVEYSVDGSRYAMARHAYLPLNEHACVGLMCASPQGDGFRATFASFSIRSR